MPKGRLKSLLSVFYFAESVNKATSFCSKSLKCFSAYFSLT
ncbi:hypothetical protein NEOC65_000201 [Neochlamydia sp. AcF65]|nr:hypothetical protein [Neochlamydia sp. AcF65]MBS4170515.1 hypothetical protein [Neochlamydia sp. AcF95]